MVCTRMNISGKGYCGFLLKRLSNPGESGNALYPDATVVWPIFQNRVLSDESHGMGDAPKLFEYIQLMTF